jgi:hypothetical protein
MPASWSEASFAICATTSGCAAAKAGVSGLPRWITEEARSRILSVTPGRPDFNDSPEACTDSLTDSPRQSCRRGSPAHDARHTLPGRELLPLAHSLGIELGPLERVAWVLDGEPAVT